MELQLQCQELGIQVVDIARQETAVIKYWCLFSNFNFKKIEHYLVRIQKIVLVLVRTFLTARCCSLHLML